ncbi:MAG: hypothetical protein R3B06_04265 [Kofleriaceae bacterium]
MAILCGLVAWLLVASWHLAWDGKHVGVVVVGVATMVVALAVTGAYRAWPGGHVTFTDDAVVVQRGRRPVRYVRADGIVASVQQVNVQLTMALVPVGTVDRGQLIRIGRGPAQVALSTLLVPRAARAALVADLARAVQGEPATGAAPPASTSSPASAPAPAPRTAAEDRLDAALRDAE